MLMTCQLLRIAYLKPLFLVIGVLMLVHGPSFSQTSGRDSARVEVAHGKLRGLVAPLTIPLVLSGNFGELRSDHFHTGLDFKTQGQEGFPVMASTGGVVARVKVSPYGYGRAIYLNGPQGMTTVYAHLQRFEPALEMWVREQQYKDKTFEWDGAPRRAFVYEQGDTIGWSGNSGSSGGPHLHFEVRETATQRPINPLLFDFEVADHVAPQLRAIWLIPHAGSTVDGRSYPVRYEQFGRKISIAGKARIAIDALDRLDGAANRCGVYRAEMMIDSNVVFAWQLDTLDFALGRDMNAHAFYPEWESTGEQVHRMHRLPGNRLPIYRSESRSAELSSAICSNHSESVASGQEARAELSIRLWDVHGNLTTGVWKLAFQPVAIDSSAVHSERLRAFDAEAFISDSSGASVRISPSTFYEDFQLELSRNIDETWSVGDPKLPASKSLEVRLPWPSHASLNRSDNWVAERLGDKNEVLDVYTGKADASGLLFSTKMTGRYRLNQDTVAPAITPHRRHRSNSDTALVVSDSELRFSLSDNLSGIESVNGALDDQWILLQWDPKKERIWYEISDARHAKRKWQRLVIQVEDAVGNRAEWRGDVWFE